MNRAAPSNTTGPSTTAPIISPEAKALNALLHLSKRCRETKVKKELEFILVNETFNLCPYQQAALWSSADGISTLSGVATPENNAPFVQWLNTLCKQLAKQSDEPQLVTAQTKTQKGKHAEDWHTWLPEHGLFIPLNTSSDEKTSTAVFFARKEPWHEYEQLILQEWTAIWNRSNEAIQPHGLWQHTQHPSRSLVKKILLYPFHLRRIVLALAVGALFIPVQLSVLAPAELIPLNPEVIRAPLDGVIAEIQVQPNEQISSGTALLSYDRTSLQNKLQLAEDELAVIKANYQQKSQQALYDSRHRPELALLKGQITAKETEISYLKSLVARGIVLSSRSGIALFNDPSEWEGRPVMTGEKILIVADEQNVEIEAWLSPSDLISLDEQTRVTLFLNSDPLNPIEAQLQYIAHEAELRPNGTYAYRLRASLNKELITPRIGLKGTAKIQGEEVHLGYWISRRPLAAARAWLGI